MLSPIPPPVASWAAAQNALLEVLLAAPQGANATQFVTRHAVGTTPRGLSAYQANGHALAERALAGAYPVVQQMLGEESFAALARALWHATPPQRGDVACWGEALDRFVLADSQLRDVPYLSAVASCEWALHRAASAADATPDWSGLPLLTQRDPEDLHMRLCPALAVLPCQWPVVTLLHAHGVAAVAAADLPTLADAAAAVQARRAQTAVVWREGWRPCVREALAHEAAFLDAVQRGETLGQALTAAPDLDFGAWLNLAVRSALLCAVVPKESL